MASLRDLGSMNGTHVTGKFPYRFDPKRDPIDIIAVAARHGIDYLLTWNCKHIANAEIIRAAGSGDPRRRVPRPDHLHTHRTLWRPRT